MTSKLQINFIAYACLFASGMATLVYELIWFRYLTLVFGASLYALSAVLCAFMLGLACGAWVMGRILARVGVSKQLILWYGLIEGFIGLYAWFFPSGLELLEKIYPLVLPADGQTGLSTHIMEFIFGTFLMLPAMPDSRVQALSDLLGLFYIAQASIVAAYFGATAFMSRR